MPGLWLFSMSYLAGPSACTFAGDIATASVGNGRRPHPRFRNKRLRFCPEAVTRASQLTEPVPTQAKTSHPVPFFGLSEEWFDPHFTFVHGLLIGERLVIALHSFHVIGVKRTMQLPTVVTLRALRFDWTGRAAWLGLHDTPPFPLSVLYETDAVVAFEGTDRDHERHHT
jgi:hypothetical protein